MNINFNISPSLIKRLVEAVERFVDDYATVHVREIYEVKASKTVDKKVGTSYYQSDVALYRAEQEEKARRLEEYGEETS